MSDRCVYLAKYRLNTSQRAHFALFFPNAEHDRTDLSQNYKHVQCKGTIIHVLGEPITNGYALEFKRNYECSVSRDLKELVLLGYVNSAHLFCPMESEFFIESTPRAHLEHEATKVKPPPGGQNFLAPVDGVNTRRCQEWTMEYLQRLAISNLISREAVDLAQGERDAPNHDIFGRKATVDH